MPEDQERILTWDEYFMALAILASKRSKDPNTKVGACIANEQNRIVGLGYNGFPHNCSDNEFPWKRDGEGLDSKYLYVCHAELNAILNSNRADLSNCTLYSPLFPCNECAKAIIQSRISRVIYICDKYKDTISVKASKRMFDAAGVKYQRLDSDIERIEILFDENSI